jgi:P4 family phage/plasmid primase-like protien
MKKLFDPEKVVDDAVDDPFTEDALARRFSAQHEHELRFVALKSQWLRWDGTRWAPESTLLAFDLARATCRNAAADYGNGKPPAKVLKAATVAAVQTLARADRRQAATLEQFDSNPWLITAANETIDLHSGVGKPPDPNDYISRKLGCTVAPPDSPHPKWTAFLKRVTADQAELVSFLQRYLGYCLTGITSEHRFVFAHGAGANGKSTLLNVVGRIFGDYATVADVGTFLAHNQERHPTDVAKLQGARLVVAQETERGRRWDEVKIKTMTGGDKMTARFMRQDFFDFTPVFKLFITGNNKPSLDNVDEAMRRRLMIVPFTVQIPPEERDPQLPEKLMKEAPAILRWCIDGCLQWQRSGLNPPAIVTEATEAYFSDQDTIGQWLEECTADGGPYAFTKSGTLYASWKQWCDQHGCTPGTAKSFSQILSDRGYIQKKGAHRGVRGFSRLVLQTEQQSDRE